MFQQLCDRAQAREVEVQLHSQGILSLREGVVRDLKQQFHQNAQWSRPETYHRIERPFGNHVEERIPKRYLLAERKKITLDKQAVE